MPLPRPDDLHELEVHLLDGIAGLRARDGSPDAPVDPTGTSRLDADALFSAQVESRCLDHTARWLRGEGHGYYTIASAGHESNAAVALALRPTDPALLHYRSGGFYCARAGQVGHDAAGDVLRGMLARSTEPMAGGRHKVFGHPDLHVVPQTSTIASHLPRAVGLAVSLGHRAPGVGRHAADGVVVASIGDASLNHTTAQGALNWAAHTRHRGLRVPLLVVVEDNGLGISVPSPHGWVAASLRGRPGLHVERADGTDPVAVHRATALLAARAREGGQPGILHLDTVRFLGHAGSDVETGYRSPAEIRADHARDPLLATARVLVARGHDPTALVERYLACRAALRARARTLLDEPLLADARAVEAPLAPRDAATVASVARGLHRRPPSGAPPGGAARTLAQAINATLDDALAVDDRVLVMGEDVGRKGGVYGVTKGLQRTHGPRRVFDTLLDETSILGLALGAALDGHVPVPEIQYLAYLHNAEDQLRGEAATLRFFSDGQYRNGMVVRIAGYAYQEGFGGHFHNDNGLAVLRDVPGLVVASPSHPADAAPMLRTCLAAAAVDGTVSVYLEPIARYHSRDLHEPGDGLWLADDTHVDVPIGRAAVHGDGRDLTIVSFANGAWMARRAARRLAEEHGVAARVLDLRWLAPLPVDDLLGAARATGHVLVADETRHSGGVGEGVVTALVEGGFEGRVARVASRDSFVPLGPAADHVLLQVDDVVRAAVALRDR